MADFIDRKTGDKLFSATVSEGHLIHCGNEIDLEIRGNVRRYRITNIVVPVKRGWFGSGRFGDGKIFLEEIARDTADKVANWL
ncbi:hypothetical protein HFO56_02830 [Rhizobium laguerreae]|uniref:hypothetical protein n=1 Tax=Rhizobium laguerreae TaxID=1076926 RepID=UPI001C90AF2B|nr:hypothetical protein [Rhizobium laguerreae]MBY3151321.1 hypothetical protein [Rhizobium laguerreae]MBY3433516.1 hypothetical protein [Rhizobium laguerreae]